MSTIDEKRVYGDRTGATDAYVASGVGVVRVSIAGDTVGEFGLVEHCGAVDVAANERTVAVATDEDVLVHAHSHTHSHSHSHENRSRTGDGRDATDEFVETGFGPAVAVGFDGTALLAAGPDGRVSRLADDERVDGDRSNPDGDRDWNWDWDTLEAPSMALEVRSIAGDLVATADGVCRVRDRSLEYVGLSDVRDVSAAGIPLAATDQGLFALGNGWVRSSTGRFEVVTADPSSEQGSLRRAHAVSGLDVYEHRDGDWLEFTRTSVPLADLAYGETVYAVTENGTMLAAVEDGERWRSRTLGVGSVEAMAIPPAPNTQ